MIHLHNGVLVIRIWKWNNFQMELCLFPPHKYVGAHKHELENIELLHVWGIGTNYYRYTTVSNRRQATTTWRDTFRSYSIPAGYWHGAQVGKWGLITISCQKWIKNAKPTSVTEDLYYA